jgi:hypothetical protein
MDLPLSSPNASRRAAGAVLAAVTAAGLLTACGSTGHDSSPNAPATSSRSASAAVAAAYDRTTSARSAKLTLSADVSLGGGKQPVHVSATGVIDFARRASELTVTLPDGIGTVAVRYLSGIVYAKLPAALAGMLPGAMAGAASTGSWVSLDLSSLSQARLGTSLQQLEAAAPSDPGQVLDYLRGAGEDVKNAGPATIDGIGTTRYTTAIDLDKAVAKLPASARAGITQFEQRLGTHTLPAQLWIDGQGRLRRMTVVARQTQLTLTLSDFGTPVRVSAPPADRTTDLTTLLTGSH